MLFTAFCSVAVTGPIEVNNSVDLLHLFKRDGPILLIGVSTTLNMIVSCRTLRLSPSTKCCNIMPPITQCDTNFQGRNSRPFPVEQFHLPHLNMHTEVVKNLFCHPIAVQVLLQCDAVQVKTLRALRACLGMITAPYGSKLWKPCLLSRRAQVMPCRPNMILTLWRPRPKWLSAS
jgi:hypothetical protein